MKRVDFLTEHVADPDNLRLAFWKASKGKRYSAAVLAYQRNLDPNLLRLREQILAGQVEVGNYRFFKIFDPKERQICASAFSEQVLHHALMNICHDDFERVQIDDSYACRKGKGTYAAIERAKTFARRYEWFLKLDVRKFFESVHHDVLLAQLDKMYKDRRLLNIFRQIIDSYEAHPAFVSSADKPDRGLPIGNLTSQYFANHYLAGLDHFIKEKLRVSAYVRYMDDMVLWHDDRQALKNAREAIRKYVEDNLLCDLKPPLLNRKLRGLPFLGYLIRPQYLMLSQRSRRRFIKKMQILDDNYHSGVWSEAACQRHALPLIAFTLHADAYKLRENVLLFLKGQSSQGR